METEPALPPLVALLDAALAFRGASLVIYRRRTLVELKTERLTSRVTRYVEDGHASWQIGAFDDHHCHLDLDAITAVVFGAEPVSCQGGRLNYTVWFEESGDAGNPYRPAASCSVTLNAPYEPDGTPRLELIRPFFELFDRSRELAGVSAEKTFEEQRVWVFASRP